tara:strand:+ start:360 stop:614 length:255 start_codon:yes stop_codon:yes gene_type:complete
MKHETSFATVENVVTAFCFGVGALLVVLALYTLVAVKSVNAENSLQHRFEDGHATAGKQASISLRTMIRPLAGAVGDGRSLSIG